MTVFSLGYQRLRNGNGEKFYVAKFWMQFPGSVRYSLRRFERAEEAEAYGNRSVRRYVRRYMKITADGRKQTAFSIRHSVSDVP